jgi:protein-S-isoprenylcysteine O-methyltransferase Ste14
MKQAFWHRGGAWVLAQSALMAAVIALGVLFPGDWSNLAAILIGSVLFLLGGGVGIAGVWVLGRNRTPFPRPREGSEFIQRGIYARVRHPLYTSVMLASLGWALIWQSWPSLVGALALIPFFLAKARHEERWLQAAFPSYATYASQVPGFIPRPRRSPAPPLTGESRRQRE